MSRIFLQFLLILTFPIIGNAKEPISIPSEIKTSPGRLVRLSVQTDPQDLVVKWIVPGDCDVIPFPDGKTAIFTTPNPGKYQIFLYAALDKNQPTDPVSCTIIVEGASPPPGDPFRLAIQEALRQDGATTEQRNILFTFYNTTAPSIVSALNFNNLSDFQSELRNRLLLPPNSLINTRRLISQEFLNAFGSQDRPFDSTKDKQTALQLFTKIAVAVK